MKSYTDILDDNFKFKKENEIIYNSSPKHAKMIWEKILDTKEKDDNLYIFTGGNDGDFFIKDPQISEKLTKMKDTTFLILDQNSTKDKFETIFKNISTVSSSHKAEPFSIPEINKRDYEKIRHFCVTGNMFRMEKQHENNAKIIKAVAGSNFFKVAEKLKEIFKNIETKS